MDLYDVIVLGLPINRAPVDQVARRYSLDGLGEELPALLAASLEIDDARLLIREVERLGARASIRPALRAATVRHQGAELTSGSVPAVTSSGAQVAVQGRETSPSGPRALATRDLSTSGAAVHPEHVQGGAPAGRGAATQTQIATEARPTLRDDGLLGTEHPNALRKQEAATREDLAAEVRAAQELNATRGEGSFFAHPMHSEDPFSEEDPFFASVTERPDTMPPGLSGAVGTNHPFGPTRAQGTGRPADTMTGGGLLEVDLTRRSATTEKPIEHTAAGRDLELDFGDAPVPLRLGSADAPAPLSAPPARARADSASVGVVVRTRADSASVGVATRARADSASVGVAKPASGARRAPPSALRRKGEEFAGYWSSVGEAFVLPLRGPALGWYALILGLGVVLGGGMLFALLIPIIGLFVALIGSSILLSLNAHFLAANYHAASVGVNEPGSVPSLSSDVKGTLILPGIFIVLLIGAFVALPLLLYGQALQRTGTLPGFGALLALFPVFLYLPMALTTMAHSGSVLGAWHLGQGIRAIAREPVRYLSVVVLCWLASVLPGALGSILGAIFAALGMGWLGALSGGLLGALGLTYALGVAGALMGFLVRENPLLFER